jgi:hypothetical protein
MNKRLALTKDGQLTYCSSDDEHIGKGSCKHVAHQKLGESQQQFMNRINNKCPICGCMNGNHIAGCSFYQNEHGENNMKILDETGIDFLYQKYLDGGWPEQTAMRLAKIDQCKMGINLDQYINDEDETVRQYVAKQGYHLEILAKDGEPLVRRTVASMMAKLDRNSDEFGRLSNALKDDKNYDVRLALHRMGVEPSHPIEQENKHAVYSRSLKDQIHDFQEIPKNMDIFDVLWNQMNDALRLNMANNSMDFETLVLLAENGEGDESKIAKHRAKKLGFYDDADRIDELIKNNFK